MVAGAHLHSNSPLPEPSLPTGQPLAASEIEAWFAHARYGQDGAGASGRFRQLSEQLIAGKDCRLCSVLPEHRLSAVKVMDQAADLATLLPALYLFFFINFSLFS